jgi:hypothetical protein
MVFNLPLYIFARSVFHSFVYVQDGLTALDRAKEPAFEYALPSLQRHKNDIIRLFEVRMRAHMSMLTCGFFSVITTFIDVYVYCARLFFILIYMESVFFFAIECNNLFQSVIIMISINQSRA